MTELWLCVSYTETDADIVSQWGGLWRVVWPQKKLKRWDWTRQRCRCNGTSCPKHTDAVAFSRMKIQHTTVKTWFNNETAAESFTGHIYSKSPPPHCVFDSKPRPLITYTPHQPTAGRRCDDIKSLYSLVHWKLNNTISGFDCRFIWIISIYNFQK